MKRAGLHATIRSDRDNVAARFAVVARKQARHRQTIAEAHRHATKNQTVGDSLRRRAIVIGTQAARCIGPDIEQQRHIVAACRGQRGQQMRQRAQACAIDKKARAPALTKAAQGLGGALPRRAVIDRQAHNAEATGEVWPHRVIDARAVGGDVLGQRRARV